MLKSLLYNNFIVCNKDNSSSLCEPCQLGKFIRLPFFRLNNVENNVFDVIHSDIRTSLISSISGIQYNVIFINYNSQVNVSRSAGGRDLEAITHQSFAPKQRRFNTYLSFMSSRQEHIYRNIPRHLRFISY